MYMLHIYASLFYSLGNNARKVISEVYEFFVIVICTVLGRKSKHKTDVTACHEINFHTKIIYENSVHRKLECFYPPRILDEH